MDKDVSILAASDFLLISQDGTNYQLATTYSERVNGDLYVAGMPVTGYVQYVRDDTTSIAAAADCWLGEDSAGNRYALADNRYVIKDDPAGARYKRQTSIRWGVPILLGINGILAGLLITTMYMPSPDPGLCTDSQQVI